MTLSIILAAIGFSLLAIVTILDKFIVSNEKVSPLVFVFYSTIIALPLVLITPFAEPLATTRLWIFAGVSGTSYAIALYTLYKGFQASEVSHVGPLVGAMVPIFTILLSTFFAPEIFSQNQMFGIGLLVFGSLIISIENDKHFFGWHESMLWGVVAAFFFALFYTTAKPVYDGAGFYPGFVWVWLPMGLWGIALLVFSKAVRKHVFTKRKKQAATNHKDTLIIISNKVAAFAAVGLTQYAVSIGSVTIVNALTGLQYAVLVTLVGVLSHFKPKLFKEEYTHGEVLQETLAVLLIIAGLALLLV